MSSVDAVVAYNGRSPDRRRPAGPSHSTLRLFDLLVSRPEGVTYEEAAEHLAIGFPTDQYRAYAKTRLGQRRRHGFAEDESGTSSSDYGNPSFQRAAHRWLASKKLLRMKKLGTAIQSDGRWFAGRPPLVVVDGQRVPYEPAAEAARTSEGIEAINNITVLRALQRRLRNQRERDAIEWVIKRVRPDAPRTRI